MKQGRYKELINLHSPDIEEKSNIKLSDNLGFKQLMFIGNYK